MIRIVTDSNSSLPSDLLEQYSITQIPIYVTFGDETLRDGIDLSITEFYKRLANSKELPTTSQPSVGDFESLYRRLLEDDPRRTIISVHLSSQLSGTIASARQAVAMLPFADIRVFDSRSISLGYGFMALEAARLAREKASVEAIMEHLADMRDRMEVYTVFNTLDYLAKGGRIGRATHLLGSLLDLKPILTVREGLTAAQGRYRTFNRALSVMHDLALEGAKGQENLLLGVMHADSEDAAQRLAEELEEALQPTMTVIGAVGSGLGTHVGPGAVGVAWYSPMPSG